MSLYDLLARGFNPGQGMVDASRTNLAGAQARHEMEQERLANQQAQTDAGQKQLLDMLKYQLAIKKFNHDQNKQTSAIQNYEYGLSNPSFAEAQLKKAKASAPNVSVDNSVDMGQAQQKGADKAAQTIGSEMVKKLVEDYGEMEQYQNSFQRTIDAEQLLDEGMITGFGANFRVGLGKALSLAGFTQFDDPIQNTEAYAAMMGNETGQIIKMFGSGTGLSDADRAYAQKIAAGEITLDEKSLRKLLRLRRKYLLKGMRNYQTRVQKMQPKWGSLFPYDIGIDIPKGYTNEGYKIPAKGASKPQQNNSGWSIQRVD